ncbi:hypothetical protein ACWGPW_21295 [Paenibacillus chitinolyticus]
MADSLPIGDIRFYDNKIPGLEAGTYTVTVSHQIEGLGLSEAEQQQLTAVQSFTVSGPQFALDASEIHSVVPPATASGDFGGELPHIVLNEPILPWERSMSAAGTPWLGLLVFKEGELLPGDPDATDAATCAIRTTAGDFMALQGSGDILIPPGLVKDPAVPDSLPCRYIQMSKEQFQAMTPYAAELPYLAHVREINAGDKASAGDDGWYGVVVANRLVASDQDRGNYTVHLVSFEGMESMMAAEATIAQPTVALLSMTSWSFRCLSSDGENFGGLAAGIAQGGMSGGEYNPDLLWLRHPQAGQVTAGDAAHTEAANRLMNGYVALPYHTRTGEDTFAWYRGPLAPAVPATLAKSTPFLSSDAALIYDAANGLFDCSIASAWEIGRFMALADESFGRTLLQYRQQSTGLTQKLYAHAEAHGLTEAGDLQKLAHPGAVKHSWLDTLAKDLGRLIGRKHSAESAESEQASVPVASGAVRKRAESPSSDRTASLRRFMQQEDIRQMARDGASEPLQAAAAWIARKVLLENVPFGHLVPIESMLPPESIRFFYMDMNWMDAMLDGMMSVAMQSRLDTLAYQLDKEAIVAAVKSNLESYGNGLQGDGADPGPDGETRVAGFLLRSALVSGWPGMSVRAFDAQGNPLKLLRLSRLSSGIMLALFWGVSSSLAFSEPQEGLRFGIDDAGSLDLRSLSTTNAQYPFGSELGIHLPLSGDYLRNGEYLNLNPDDPNGLVQSVAGLISQKLAEGALAISPSDLALQLVKAPERQIFVPDSSAFALPENGKQERETGRNQGGND